MSARIRSRLRRALRVVAVASGVIAAVAGAALIALHTDAGRDRLRRAAESRLDGVLGGPVRIARLDGSVLGELVAHGVEVDGPDRTPMVTIGALRVDLALAPLLGEVVRLDHVRAEDVTVTVPVTWERPAAAPSAWDLDLRDVGVSRARVILERAAPASAIELPELDATGAARLPPGLAAPSLHALVRSTWRAGRLPGLAQAGHATASLVQTPDGPPSALIAAAIGEVPVYAGVVGDLAARRLVGLVIAPRIDVGAATAGRHTGTACAALGLDVVVPGRGVATLSGGAVAVAGGDVDGYTLDGALAQVQAAAGHAHVDARLAGPGARAVVTAETAFGDAAATLTHAHVTVTADAARLTGGRVTAAAPVTAELDVAGVLAPSPRLTLRGDVDALRAGTTGFSTTRVRAALDLRDLPGELAGSARVTATGLHHGPDALGDLVASAIPEHDRRVSVTVRSAPGPGGWVIDAAGLVDIGDVVRVDLGHHQVAGAGQRWEGHGGTIEIARDRVRARGVRAAGPSGAIEVTSASWPRSGAGDVALAVSARGVVLAGVERILGLPAPWRGVVDARVAVERHAGRWTGTAAAEAHQLVRDAAAPPIDAHVQAQLASSRLSVSADAIGPALGRAAIVLDAVPPANVADPAAWRRIPRSAIRSAHVALARLDLAALGRVAHVALAPGSVDGELTVAGADVRGGFQVRGVGVDMRGRPARLDAELGIAPDGDDLAATATATALGITARGRATFTPPDRPLDPAAWRDLGARAARDASLQISDTPIETVLAALGIASPMTGTLSASLDMPDLTSGARFTVGVRGLHGGPVIRAIDATCAGVIDDHGATVDAAVRDAARELARGHATAPLDVLALVARDPAAIDQVPLAGWLTVDATRSAGSPDRGAITPISLGAVLGVIGRDDVSGTVDASLALDGTIGDPRVTGRLAAHDVRGKTILGDPTPAMRELLITAQWHRHAFDVVATASEAAGHTLRASARGDLAALAQLQVAIDAQQFDLGPLAVFVPGPLAGAGGVVDGKLEQRGLEPELGLHGKLHVANGRMPIAPAVGTLQGAAIDLTVDRGQVTVALDGRLGSGRAQITGTASLSRTDATSADATITLHHVQPISANHPVVDARITAHLGRTAGQWRATLAVHDASVTVPDAQGQELHPVGAPADLVFGDSRAPRRVRGDPVAYPAARPGLVAELEIEPAHVTSPEFRGDVGGRLTVTVGDGLSLDGSLAAANADVDLRGRRYVVDRAAVYFDGPIDPVLDIALSFDFPEVTLYAKIGGRASKPDLALSSSPAGYTQDQLFGFFVGGAPGGDASKAAAATSAAVGAASTMVTAVVNRLLPSQLSGDVQLRYETATATSSAAVVVGLWLTRRVFVAGRSRTTPLPVTENGSEGDLEWWLGGNWMLQGTFGNRSVGGADLLWRDRW